MYAPTRFRETGEVAAMVEALRPVADAVRKKKYHLPDGEPKPSHFRIELNLSIAECRTIMRLVDAADLATLIDAAA